MPESASSLVILARPLLPLVKTVSSYCNRLHQERKVGKSLSEQSTDIADGILDQTLDRLRGGNIEDQWWKEILNRIGQEYITPDSLRSHIWQKWLAKTKVTEDLKLLAKAKIMDRDEDPEVRARLAKSYPDRTYEVHPMEFEPVDLVVAILVAGYLEPISHDQKVLLGTVQLLEANIVKHFDELGKKLSKTTSDSITQNAHTEHAKRELRKILTLAIFDPSRSRLDIQELVHRMFEGDLCLTSDSQKTEILVRCARLCAQDMETLALAKKFVMNLTRHNRRLTCQSLMR